MGKYQKSVMWAVGVLLTLGFAADVVEYLFIEQPAGISILAELGWTLLFLVTLATIEFVLWRVFAAYNARRAAAPIGRG